MYFVRIGNRVINLDNVTEMSHRIGLGASSKLEGIVISFDHENYAVVYSTDAGYQDLAKWMERQPHIRFIAVEQQQKDL